MGFRRFRVVLARRAHRASMWSMLCQVYALVVCLTLNSFSFVNQTLSVAWNDAPDNGLIGYGFLNEESKLHFFNVSTLEIFPRALNEGPTSTLVSDGYLDDLLRTSRVRTRTFSAPRFTPGQNKQSTWKQPGWLLWNAADARQRGPHDAPSGNASTHPGQHERADSSRRIEHDFETVHHTTSRPSQHYNSLEWPSQANHNAKNTSDSVHTFSYTFYDGLYHQSFAAHSYTQHTSPDNCNMWLKSCISSTASSVLLLLLLTTIVAILSFTYYSIPIQVRLYTHQLSQEFWRHSTAAMRCLLTSVAHHCFVASCRHYDVQAKYLNAQQRKHGLSIYERVIYYTVIYTEGSQPTYMFHLLV